MWQVLYGSYETKIFKNITKHIKLPIAFSSDISRVLRTFNFKGDVLKDEAGNDIKVSSGDTIIVTKDLLYNEIKLCGSVKKPSRKLITYDYANRKWKKSFNWVCRERDSSNKVFSKVYTKQKISEIISDIIMNYMFSEEFGGIMSNGTIIEPFTMEVEDQTVDYFEVESKSGTDAIISLLELLLLYTRFKYFSEPNSISTISYFKQLHIYDYSGFSAPSYWEINDYALYTGRIPNPDYKMGYTDQPEYITGYQLPTISEDEDDIINFIELYGQVVYEADMESLERMEQTATEYKSTYDLDYGAKAIASVCNNPVKTTINKLLSMTTSSFSILSSDAWAFEATFNVRITNHSGVVNDRIILSMDGAIMNLNLPLTFTPTGYEFVELSGNLPIFSANLDYYPEVGAVIDLKGSQRGQVRFLTRSVPNAGSSFTVYYSRVQQYCEPQILPESIHQYELRSFKKEFNFIMSKDMLIKFIDAIQQAIPNIEITGTAYLDKEMEAGYKIQINITDEFEGVLKVSSVSCKYYGEKYGKDVIQSEYVMSDKKFDFNDILRQMEKRFKDSLIKPTGAGTPKFKLADSISIVDSCVITKALLAPIATDATHITANGFYLNFTTTDMDNYVYISKDNFVTHEVFALGVYGTPGDISIYIELPTTGINYQYRVKSYSPFTGFSGYSNIITVDMASLPMLFFSAADMSYSSEPSWIMSMDNNNSFTKIYNPNIGYYNDTAYAHLPTYSPVTDKVYFLEHDGVGYEIFKCNKDGSSVLQITSTHFGGYRVNRVAVSPDGSKLAFLKSQWQNSVFLPWDGSYYGYGEVYVMNENGTSIVDTGITQAWTIDFNKTSNKILASMYLKTATYNLDGTGEQVISSEDIYHSVYSPDYKKILYVKLVGSYYQIFIMDADGSNKTQLTTSPIHKGYPCFNSTMTKIAFNVDFRKYGYWGSQQDAVVKIMDYPVIDGDYYTGIPSFTLNFPNKTNGLLNNGWKKVYI